MRALAVLLGADKEVVHMTVLTGLLILVALVVTAALAVLGTIAAVVEILPPRFGQADESVAAGLSTPRPHRLRRSGSQATGTRA